MVYRDTIFTIIVYPESIEIRYSRLRSILDMYHDVVSLAVSSRFSCVLCFCGCTRASCMLFGHSNPRVSPDVSSQGSLSKVYNVETTIGRHPVSRVVQRTLGKYAALSVGVE